jgi:GT2 family glycosyltransferase
MGSQTADSPRVAVVVVNYNGWRDTCACVNALANQTYANRHVVVVDNHSGDDSVARLHEEFPGLKVLEQAENRGFAAGSNAGIRWALADGSDFVWLLNNDTIASLDALQHLVTTAQADASIGAVGSPIFDMRNHTLLRAWAGGWVSLKTGLGGHLRHRVPPERLDYLTAASMLIRAQALREVGLLDEGFFMYWEDADLCLRLRRAGWKLAVAEQTAIYHKEGASFGGKWIRRDEIVTASEVRFFRKHAPAPWIPLLVRTGLRSAKRFLRWEVRRGVAVWRSLMEAARDRPQLK